MKCEVCGNEASIVYRIHADGVSKRHCLCAECASETGIGDFLNEKLGGILGGFLSEMLSSSTTEPTEFDGFPSAGGGMIVPTTVLTIRPWTPTAMSPAESAIPADAGEEVKARMALEALKAKMAEAVEAEDYEQAAQLRDQLRELERAGEELKDG